MQPEPRNSNGNGKGNRVIDHQPFFQRFGGMLDPIAINKLDHVISMVQNYSASRWDLMRGQSQGADDRRDINDECGYPINLGIADYKRMYNRNPIAKRVVHLMAKETWQVTPVVTDSKDAKEPTPFTMSLEELDRTLRGEASWFKQDERKGSPFWSLLRRAQMLAGIGTFGIIFLGLDDNTPWDTPVKGFIEKNSMPMKSNPNKPKDKDEEKDSEVGKGNGNGSPPRMNGNKIPIQNAYKSPYSLTINKEETKGRKILFMRAFDESLVYVTQYETNRTSPRWGRPTMYNVNFSAVGFDDATAGGGRGGIGLPMLSANVHWTRVVHIPGENIENSDLFAVSELHTTWNNLSNLEKIYGADGETFWRNCVLKLFFETHPQLGGDVEIDKAAFQDEFEQFINGLQQAMITTGGSMKAIPPSVVDPTPHVKTNIEAICIVKGCPTRVFMGSERGELASSQDDSAWNDRVRFTEDNYNTPIVVVPTIDRLIQVGVLQEPENEGYSCSWPDLESSGEAERATIAKTWTDVLAEYISAGVENLMPPMHFLTMIMGMTDDEAELIIEEAKAQAEDELLTQDPPPEEPAVNPMTVKQGDKLIHPQTGKEIAQGFPPKKDKVTSNQLRDASDWVTRNVFCSTGPGGGIDPSCSGGQSGNETVSIREKELRIAVTKSSFKTEKSTVGYGEHKETRHLVRSKSGKDIGTIVDRQVAIGQGSGGGFDRVVTATTASGKSVGSFKNVDDAKHALAVRLVSRAIAKQAKGGTAK